MLPRRYPASLRILHWLIATLTLAALFFGTFVMARLPGDAPHRGFVLVKHMLAGGLLLALTLLRLFIRPHTQRPPPMPSGIAIADWIVPYVHRIFDLLVLAMVGSGIAIAVASGLPALLLQHGALPDNFSALSVHTLHVIVSRILAGFIALHVCGAFYHQFILRDRLLSRMSLTALRSQENPVSISHPAA